MCCLSLRGETISQAPVQDQKRNELVHEGRKTQVKSEKSNKKEIAQ